MSDSPGHIFSPPTIRPSQLSHQAWPLDIPPLDLLYHRVETIFALVPFTTRLLASQTSRTCPSRWHPCNSLTLQPNNSGTSSSNIRPYKQRHRFLPIGNPVPQIWKCQNEPVFPRILEGVVGDNENSFGELHIIWCVATLGW